MGEVHSISADLPVPGGVNPEIVQRLRQLLEQAEAGMIEGLAVAAVRCDGGLITGWDSRVWAPLAAAVGTLHHRVFSEGEVG